MVTIKLNVFIALVFYALSPATAAQKAPQHLPQYTKINSQMKSKSENSHYPTRPHPRGYVALKASRPPPMNGKLEGPWLHAPWSQPFMDIEGPDKVQGRDITSCSCTGAGIPCDTCARLPNLGELPGSRGPGQLPISRQHPQRTTSIGDFASAFVCGTMHNLRTP